MRNRAALLILLCADLLIILGAVWFVARNRHAPPAATGAAAPQQQVAVALRPVNPNPNAATNVYAHNLMLRKGPNFRIYVRWLRGRVARSHPSVVPSFDDPESFYLDVQTGLVRANIGDLNNFLNASIASSSPFRNISISGNGDQVKIAGTLHKGVPLPVSISGSISVIPDNQIQLHVKKIDVLKLPVKGLLGVFKVKLDDIFHPAQLPGITVKDNDVFFDSQALLPPPHIRGHLTQIRVDNPDLEEVYGNAEKDVNRVEQWRNFLRLRDGSIDFGKLTMHNVDLIMIDISNDAWFDLDLNNYQAQLVNGYTRMTPEAGLQIFMPDLATLPKTKANQNIGIQWMKNRNIAPPREIYSK